MDRPRLTGGSAEIYINNVKITKEYVKYQCRPEIILQVDRYGEYWRGDQTRIFEDYQQYRIEVNLKIEVRGTLSS